MRKRTRWARPVLVAYLAALLAALPVGPGEAAGRSARWCGTSPWGALSSVWAHFEKAQRFGSALPAEAIAPSAASEDVGEIAVIQDNGDLMLPRNLLDLQGALLEFSTQRSGYRLIRSDRVVSPDAGAVLALADDDSRRVALPFAFPFYGERWSEVFVNSDGNLTFGAPDNASSSRSIGRFLAGPPRLAPLFADLDPGAGGRVETRADSGRFTVTWHEVPRFGESDRNTFQVVLYQNGRVELVYDRQLSARFEGVVGLAPGQSRGGLTPLDMSQAAGATGNGALAESFRSEVALDEVAVARRFYKSHGDEFQQLVVFTSKRAVAPGTFAYEQTVKQTDRGIGSPLFDLTAQYGSAARLESFVTLDFIGKYPDDPSQVFLGADSALGILAHETGHRWLVLASFQDGATVSRELLGRDEVHWSFFVDSDASHLEGNDIQDLGGGQFRTTAAAERYGPVDQYFMGLRKPEEVPPFFFVRNPSGTSSLDPGRWPEAGVMFGGTRRDVPFGDVLTAMGRREPAAGAKTEPWRQALVFVTNGPADPALLDKVERLRVAWGPYFARSTEGRWAVDTRLAGRRQR